MVHRLQPHTALLRSRDTTLVQGDYPMEVKTYVGRGQCKVYDRWFLMAEWPAGLPLETFLAKRGINMIYLDEQMLQWLRSQRPTESRDFLESLPPVGWQQLGGGDAPGDRWRLYRQNGDFSPDATAQMDQTLQNKRRNHE
jgi:hypothetical protein